jgi:hypothetical protein
MYGNGMEDAVKRDAQSPSGSPKRTNDVRFVITLIHGTWAKKAPWLRPDSKLSEALMQLPGGARIFPFLWSGGNSNNARHLASEQLERELALRVQNYPASRHYLIGHSHGGNVVLRAFARASFKDTIAGVICLSTPFLVARPRDLGGGNTKKQIVGGVVLPALFLAAIAGRLGSSWWGFFLAWALGIIGVSAFQAILESWWKYGHELLKDFEAPKIDPDKTLIIRSPGDEASSALDFVQLIARLTVRVWVQAMGSYKRFEATAKRWSEQKKELVAVPAIMYVVTVLLFWGLVVAHVNSHLLVAIVMTSIVVTSVVTVEAFFLFLGLVEHATIIPFALVSVLVWPAIVLLSVLLIPFGREVAKANILMDVTAETTPVGSWTVHLLNPV